MFDASNNIIADSSYERSLTGFQTATGSGVYYDISSTKIQIENVAGSLAYFLFVLDGSAAYSYFDPTETSASRVKKTYVSKFAPKINTSDVIDITGITSLQ